MVNRYLAVYREISSTPSGRQAWWICSPSITTFIFSTRPWTTLRICATVCRASSCVNRSSLWTIASIFFSPTSFRTSFSSFISQVINSLTDDGLTKFSLLCLFGRQRECGEQLHEYLDNHLIHGFCGRDLGIDLEAIEEMSNRLEQIGQGTVVIYDALDRLIRLNVTKMRAQRLNIGTYRE
jgi:hypothetical protein